MAKIIVAEVAGIKYPLLFSLGAYVKCKERLGEMSEIFEKVNFIKSQDVDSNIFLFCEMNKWALERLKYSALEEVEECDRNAIGAEKALAVWDYEEIYDVSMANIAALRAGLKREIEAEGGKKNVDATQED